MNQELIFLIKHGIITSSFEKTDIFNNKYKHIVYTPVKYTDLINYANTNSITLDELNNYIITYGSEILILDALTTTKNFNVFAKSWLKKSKLKNEVKTQYLETLGYVDTEKESNNQESVSLITPTTFVMTNQDVLLARKILKSTLKQLTTLLSKHNIPISHNSVVKTIMKSFCLDFNNYVDILSEVVDEKVFADILRHSNFDTNLLEKYLQKFSNFETVKNYVLPYVYNLRESKSKKSNRKKSTKVILDNNYVDDYLKTLQLITDSSLNIFKKTELLYNLIIFDNRKLKTTCQEISKKLALPILEAYNKLNLNTKSKDNPNYYFDKKYNKDFYSHDRFGKIFEYQLIKTLKEGHIQEYIKYYFINKCQRIDSYLRYSNAYTGFNIEKYYQTEAYKNLPIPVSCLSNFHLKKYPFFILIQNAKRRPGFTNELILDPSLYNQGFDHEIFRDPCEIPKYIIEAIEKNANDFIRNYDEQIDENRYYFIPFESSYVSGFIVQAKPNQKFNYSKLEHERYDLFIIAKKENFNIKICNKGFKAHEYIKNTFFNIDHSWYIEYMNGFGKVLKRDLDRTNNKTNQITDHDDYSSYIESLDSISTNYISTNKTQIIPAMTLEEFNNLKDIQVDENIPLDFDSDPEYMKIQDECSYHFALTEEELNEYMSEIDAHFEDIPLPDEELEK